MKIKYLNKYGNMFGELAGQINADLEAKTNEELEEIIAETNMLNGKNCGWATYRIAETVREYARFILETRVKG